MAGEFDEWIERSNPSPEFRALAPHYIEILQSLDGKPLLKRLFHSMIHFEDMDDEYNFQNHMSFCDEDAHNWSREYANRRFEKRESERINENNRIKELRLAMPLDEIIESASVHTISPLRKLSIVPGAGKKLTEGFGLSISRIEANVVSDTLSHHKVMIFVGSQGSVGRMLTIDNETDQLVLGDEFHGIDYDEEHKVFIGRLAAARYILDERGRKFEGEGYPEYNPRSKHAIATKKIIDGLR